MSACKSLNETTKNKEENKQEETDKGVEDAGQWQMGETIKGKIPMDDNLRYGVLPNGMTYYVRKNSKPENFAELRLAVNAGSILEDDSQQGLAHFVEHMAFNGTKNFPKQKLIDFLEGEGVKFGAHLNAYTSFDETVYMLRVPTNKAEAFDKGLLIMEDWASNVTMETVEIEKERGVVIEEWRTRLGAGERMRQKYFPIMFKGSHYANRLPIGKREILEEFQPNVLRKFYSDWYRPDLMAIIAVGDFDPEAVEAKIKRSFGEIPAKDFTKERKYFEVPDHKETLIATAVDKEATSNLIQLIYKHPKGNIDKVTDFRERLQYRLFNGMISDRLNELRERENPPFIGAGSYYSGITRTKDSYTCYARVDNGKWLDGLKALVQENQRVLQHGFVKTELERRKDEMLTQIRKQYNERDKTPSRSLASEYIRHYLSKEPVPGIEKELDLYENLLPTISLSEVNGLAKEWITEENLVILAIGVEDKNAPMPADEVIEEAYKSALTEQVKPYEDKVVTAPLMPNKPAKNAAKVLEENKTEEFGITEWYLSNGVRIVLKPTEFKNDEILMQATSSGGASLYNDNQHMSAFYSSQVVANSGLGEFDKILLEKYLSDKVASVTPYVGLYEEGMRGSCAPNDLETMLQMTHMYFKSPRKDEKAFKSMIARNKARYKNLLARPEYYFFDEAQKVMSQNHPRSGFPTEEKLNQIDYENAHRFYSERFADGADFTFLFVGNFSLSKIKPLLLQYLGSLPNKKTAESWKDVGIEPPPGNVDKTFYKGTEPKSLVQMHFTGEISPDLDEYHRMQSMVDVLKIMLRESMREDQGGVYGVRVRANAVRIPKNRYSITISFQCAPENTKELISTAMKDIRTLKEEGPSDKNMEKIKEIQRKDREVGMKENRYWLNKLLYYYKHNMIPGDISREADRIEALDAKAVQTAARRYLNRSNYAELKLLPEQQK